jgi:hypothetical protein
VFFCCDRGPQYYHGTRYDKHIDKHNPIQIQNAQNGNHQNIETSPFVGLQTDSCFARATLLPHRVPPMLWSCAKRYQSAAHLGVVFLLQIVRNLWCVVSLTLWCFTVNVLYQRNEEAKQRRASQLEQEKKKERDTSPSRKSERSNSPSSMTQFSNKKESKIKGGHQYPDGAHFPEDHYAAHSSPAIVTAGTIMMSGMCVGENQNVCLGVLC